MDRRLMQLLMKLPKEEYQTSSELAGLLGVSEKTIRSRLKELTEELKDNGASIISKQRCGNKLKIENKEKYQIFLDSIYEVSKKQTPSTSEERRQYLLAYLLNHEDFIKMEELGYFLCVSKYTLTNDLRNVEYLLNRYHVKLIRKPNYGIKLEGKEFGIRQCISNYLIKREQLDLGDDERIEGEMKEIGDSILPVIHQYGIQLSELSFQNLLVHIYVAGKRIKRQYTFPPAEEDFIENLQEKDMEAAEAMTQSLETLLNLTFSREEIGYIAIHLKGKRTIGTTDIKEPNLVITKRIEKLVTIILQTVYETFRIDFRHDLELRMLLAQHLVPLDVRLRFNMDLKNPILEDVKEKYMLGYTIASQACIPLRTLYKRELSEDEIGYIALIFALALEQNKRGIEKKNILLVCSSGKASAGLLAYKYKEEFEKYINQIILCDIYRLSQMDFKDIDYIFTTVPIIETVPVPILEVKLFLEGQEMAAVKEVLDKDRSDFLYDYYDERLFFTDVPGDTKEEVIEFLCEKTNEIIPLPNKFYRAVLRREDLAQTDYGNQVALPHPYKTMTKDTFVSVGILKNPIQWVQNEVQVVLLVSIANKENRKLQQFYQMTVDFMLNKTYVEQLIQERKFSVLIELLCR